MRQGNEKWGHPNIFLSKSNNLDKWLFVYFGNGESGFKLLIEIYNTFNLIVI